MNNAFEYTLKAGGVMKESDYPYTGHDNSGCKFDKTKIAARVSNFSVVSADEDQIAANLVHHGPLASKFFNQNSFLLYISKNQIFNAFSVLLYSWYQCNVDANLHRRSLMPVCVF